VAKTNEINGAQPKQGLQFHAWPESEEHFWGVWMANTPRDGAKKATKYRTCLHPKCNAAEVREVS
jgi:hypothetical protein